MRAEEISDWGLHTMAVPQQPHANYHRLLGVTYTLQEGLTYHCNQHRGLSRSKYKYPSSFLIYTQNRGACGGRDRNGSNPNISYLQCKPYIIQIEISTLGTRLRITPQFIILCQYMNLPTVQTTATSYPSVTNIQ